MIEVNTQQQEAGLEAYMKYAKEMSFIGIEPIDTFWSWYTMWCFEEGLYNDRASYQNDENEEDCDSYYELNA